MPPFKLTPVAFAIRVLIYTLHLEKRNGPVR